MSRTIVTVAAAAMMSAALLLSPLSANARRCEDSPPETLLSLYSKSSEIHVGRYVRTEDFSVSEQGEDYTVVQVRKHFTIAETLKGPSRANFFTQEDEYRYPEEDTAGEDEHGGEIVKLEPGDSVMLFTMADPESGAQVLTDYNDGVKKLTADEIKSYTNRVEELNSLFRSGEPTESAVLKWLFKAIEDPLTRWEGAYELVSGFQYIDWKKEVEASRAEQIAKGEVVENFDFQDEFFEQSAESSRYAQRLSDSDRRRLVDILISSKLIERTKDNEFSNAIAAQDAMIELVSRWPDRRVAVYMVNELRRGDGPPYGASRMMYAIAKALDSDLLEGLTEKYIEVYWEDDEKIESEHHYEVPVDPATGQPVKATTYGELRGWMVARFLEKSDALLTTGGREQPSK